MSPGTYHAGFEWTEENGLIRAGLLGLLNRADHTDVDRANLVEIVEVIVSEMDADSKLVFRRRIIDPALRGEEPAQFQIRRGPSGHYEITIEPAVS